MTSRIRAITVRVSNIEGSGEFIDFLMQVTPEFPLSTFAVLAAMLAGIVALRRFAHQPSMAAP